MRLEKGASKNLIKRLGGCRIVASILGLTRQTVYLWSRDGIPALRIDHLKKYFDDSELKKIEMFRRKGEEPI